VTEIENQGSNQLIQVCHETMSALRASAIQALQLMAPNLLLNQGPSEPCYKPTTLRTYEQDSVEWCLGVYEKCDPKISSKQKIIIGAAGLIRFVSKISVVCVWYELSGRNVLLFITSDLAGSGLWSWRPTTARGWNSAWWTSVASLLHPVVTSDHTPPTILLLLLVFC